MSDAAFAGHRVSSLSQCQQVFCVYTSLIFKEKVKMRRHRHALSIVQPISVRYLLPRQNAPSASVRQQ